MSSEDTEFKTTSQDELNILDVINSVGQLDIYNLRQIFLLLTKIIRISYNEVRIIPVYRHIYSMCTISQNLLKSATQCFIINKMLRNFRGGVQMRRLLSLVLSITMVALSVSQGFCVFAQESEINKLYNFAEELSGMVRENPVDVSCIEDNVEEEIIKADVFYGNLANTDFTGLSDDAFETKRLIVKSKKTIDYRGAVDCVSGYNNLYILQYQYLYF